MNTFGGLGVAMITPFTPDFEIDFNALENLCEHLLEKGADYLVVMGTTGESPTLSKEEKRKVFDAVIRVNRGRKPIVAGIGGNHTAEVLDTLRHFDFSGVDGVLSVSPYYNKPNQEGIFQHYRALAEISPRPIIVYNVPGRTGSNISTATTLRLAGLKNIAATKEASGNFTQCMDILKGRPPDFLVLSGDDAFTFPLMSLGMDGVISVIGNAYPAEFSRMVHLALEGDIEGARALHYQLLDLMNGIFEDGSPGGIKVILKKMGICGDTVRPPLARVNRSVEEKLIRLMS